VAKASTANTTDTVPPVTAVAPTTTTPTIPTTPGDVPPATATPPTTPTTPTTPGVPPASTPPTTPTTPSTPPSSDIAKWPAGTTAYTVVLVSASTHKQANTKAREAKSRGIDAGVLHSNNYSSLNPGYWVVFAGQYSTADEARSHIDEYASKGFSGGYPRQIKK
jgi:septal ring-binding cell division protein DamX